MTQNDINQSDWSSPANYTALTYNSPKDSRNYPKPMMWVFRISVLIVLAAKVGLAATPQEESRFLDSVRDAYTKKNIAAIMELYCWDDVDPQFKLNYPVFHNCFHDVLSVSYVTNFVYRPDSTNTGVPFIPNLKPVKKIEIVFKVKPPADSSLMEFAGEKDGKLMLVQPKIVK
jgi:hypothetical protein